VTDIIPPWTPVLDGYGGTWVGAYPYVDAADADVSYGEFVGAAGEHVGLELAPFVPEAVVIGSRLEMQVWNDADSDPVPSLYNWFVEGGHGVDVYDIGEDGIFREDITAPTATWTTLVIENPIPLELLDEALTALSTDGLSILSSMVANSIHSFTFRCSYLQFVLTSADEAPNLSGAALDDRVRFWGG